MQGILEQNTIAESFINRNGKVFGGKIGFIGTLFGCWHKNISRPFTIGNASYCACLDCGARRQFDAENLRMVGVFHYPPTVSPIENVNNN